MNLPRIVSSCSSILMYVGGFLNKKSTTSKTSFVNCGFWTFLRSNQCLEMQNLHPISNMSSQKILIGLLYRREKNLGFLSFLVPSYWSNSLWISGLWHIETNCEVACIHDLPCNVKELFQWPCCTFSKFSFSLTHCGVNFHSFCAAISFKLSRKFCPVVDPNVLRPILWCNHA